MCGLFVKVGKSNQLGKQFKLGLDAIKHRGPDDEGFAVFNGNSAEVYGSTDTSVSKNGSSDLAYLNIQDLSPDANSLDQGQVILGHRRLSIIELNELGHQPMSFGQGRYWIVYNGELYNYLLLRKDLEENHGVIFHTNSDTEVVLAAYSVWGGDALCRFDGMWSFVIYDTEKNTLFCSRDRFGIKPLYYWISPQGNLFFASEIKQFTFLEGWKSIIEEQRALEFLEHGYLDHTEFTLFEGVCQIRPGCALKIDVKKHGIFSYDFVRNSIYTWYKLSAVPVDGLNQTEKIRDLFTGSVESQLMSDVPVGITLSGGIDSSAIAVTIRSIREGEISSFTSCSEYKAFDERHWAEIVNKQIGAQSNYIVSTLDDVIEQTRKLVWIQDEPYQSQSAMMNYLVYQQVREKGIKVILCGQGADEYMGGYGQWNDIQFLNCNSFYSLLAKRKIGLSFKYLFIKHLQFSTIVQRIKRVLPKKRGVINFKKWNVGRRHILEQFQLNITDLKSNIQYFIYHAALPKYLHWEDRNSMANSVEARVPFLNHGLVEFYSSLNEEELLCSVRKGIFKDALKSLLPEEIYYRKDKKGFVNSEQLWVKEVDTEFFRTKLEIALDRIGDRIHKKGMLWDFDQMVSGKRSFDYQFWRIIIFGEWMSVFEMKFSDEG